MLLSLISFTNWYTVSPVNILFLNVLLSYSFAGLLKIVNRKCSSNSVILKLSFILTKQLLLLHISMPGFLCKLLSVQQTD